MSYKVGLRATACMGFAVTALAAHCTASAQQTPKAADSANEADIIVTARLRSERLQDVPVVATTLNATEIARYNSLSINQIATRTPGLVVTESTNPVGGGINIRGIGSPTSGPFVDQAVSINLDGIQVSQANILRLGLFDLDRVEVLKGPQTLFFGKNSPAGIISIISANPGDHLEAKLRVGYETEAHNKYVEAMVSTPLTSTLGLRVDGYFSDQRGWFRNIAQPLGSVTLSNGQTTAATTPNGSYASNGKTYFGRATLAYAAPSGMADATLKVAYGQQDSPNGISANAQLSNCPTGRYQGAAAVGRTFTECKLNRNYAEGKIAPRVAALNSVFGDGSLHANNRQFLTSLTVNVQPTDAIKLTSVSGYLDMKADTVANYAFDGSSTIGLYSLIKIKQFSQELRALTSFDSPINFMAGAYYQHVKIGYRAVIPVDTPLSGAFTGGRIPGPMILANNLHEQRTNAYSLYGQAIVDFTPQLQLTVGGRYSHERKAISAISMPNSFTPTTFPFTYTPDTKSYHDFSPDVTLRYKPAPNLTLYAAYREGFLSGGFDLQATAPSFGATSRGDVSYRQERVRGGEVGAKGSLLNRQISFDLSAFYYKYTDLQVSAYDPQSLGFRLTNAGTAITKGAEINLQFRPNALPGIFARANLAYTPAKYGSFRNGPCYTGQSQAAGCNLIASRGADGNLVITQASANQVANAQDLSGKPLLRNSKWTIGLGAGYDHALANGMTVSLSGDATHASGYFASPTEEPASWQRAAWRYDARIALSGEDNRWEVALLGSNLSNTLRATHVFVATGTGGRTGTPNAFLGDALATPGQVRMVTIQGTIRY